MVKDVVGGVLANYMTAEQVEKSISAAVGAKLDLHLKMMTEMMTAFTAGMRQAAPSQPYAYAPHPGSSTSYVLLLLPVLLGFICLLSPRLFLSSAAHCSSFAGWLSIYSRMTCIFGKVM